MIQLMICIIAACYTSIDICVNVFVFGYVTLYTYLRNVDSQIACNYWIIIIIIAIEKSVCYCLPVAWSAKKREKHSQICIKKMTKKKKNKLKMDLFVIRSNENGFKFFMSTDEDMNCFGFIRWFAIAMSLQHLCWTFVLEFQCSVNNRDHCFAVKIPKLKPIYVKGFDTNLCYQLHQGTLLMDFI